MFRDGSTGFVTADMADYDYGDTTADNHVLAFRSRSDAEQMRSLVQANLDAQDSKVQVAPIQPMLLLDTATENGYGVTVYRAGQLQLQPGMTLMDMRQAAVRDR